MKKLFAAWLLFAAVVIPSLAIAGTGFGGTGWNANGGGGGGGGPALPVSIANGGTGQVTAAAAPWALKGANADITSMTSLTGTITTVLGGATTLAQDITCHASGETASNYIIRIFNNARNAIQFQITGRGDCYATHFISLPNSAIQMDESGGLNCGPLITGGNGLALTTGTNGLTVTSANAATVPVSITGASGQTASLLKVRPNATSTADLFNAEEVAIGRGLRIGPDGYLYGGSGDSTIRVGSAISVGNTAQVSAGSFSAYGNGGFEAGGAGGAKTRLSLVSAGATSDPLAQFVGAASLTGDLISWYGNDGATKVASITPTGAINGFSLSVGAGTYGINSSGAAALASVKTGANGSVITAVKTGTVTLSSGSNTVTDTDVTANTVIMVTENTGTPVLEQFGYTVSAGSSFTIYSNNVASTAVVSYAEYVK